METQFSSLHCAYTTQPPPKKKKKKKKKVTVLRFTDHTINPRDAVSKEKKRKINKHKAASLFSIREYHISYCSISNAKTHK